MIVALLLLAFRWADLLRDTNAHAENAKGMKAFAAKQYDAAAQAFARQQALKPSPAAAYDVGTSQVAAGKKEEGAAALTRALADPRLRADALYNRGNSALAAKAYDYAIRDYKEVLRLRPRDAQAKRNLEIALAQKAMSSSGAGQSSGAGSQQQPQQQKPQPNGQQQQKPQRGKGDADAEALLRAVQQQEKEELSRMRQARPEERRIGW